MDALDGVRTAARCPFGLPGLAWAQRRGESRCAHGLPPRIASKHCGRDRASRTSADIDHVGDFALQLLEIVIVSRHGPHAVARPRGRSLNLIAPAVWMPEQAGIDAAQGDHTRASQRRDINEMRRAFLCRKQRIPEKYEPSFASLFSTSTVLPDALVNTSPGEWRVPPACSRAWDDADHAMRRRSNPMARIAATTEAPPAMSSFIRSMPSAGLIEMPPVRM